MSGTRTDKGGLKVGALAVACIAALAGALVLAGVVYVLLRHFARVEASGARRVGFVDLVKLTLGATAFVGAVFAGVYSYRKQGLAEDDARRADSAQLAARYQSAADQLGHGRPAARLAGVYAMARLADDWRDQRQTCIEVLCAYIRLPYEPDPAHREYEAGEREVRRTIIKLMRDHLRENPTGESWCGYNFSFEGAVFDCGDLSGARLTGGHVSFAGARFVGDEALDLSHTTFSGANVSFNDACFGGPPVSFRGAIFAAGKLDFTRARRLKVTFKWPDFSGAASQAPGTAVTWGDVPPPGFAAPSASTAQP